MEVGRRLYDDRERCEAKEDINEKRERERRVVDKVQRRVF